MTSNILFKYGIYHPIVSLRTKDFFSTSNSFSSSQFLNEKLHMENSFNKFKKILDYSLKNVPFYKKSLSGICSEDIKSLSDVHKLPFISKQMVIDSWTHLLSSEKHYFCVTKTTGGSTGQPVTILKSRHAMGCELAATWRGYSWAGIDIGYKQARFWGVPFNSLSKLQAYLTDFICHRKRVSAFSFDNYSLDNYANILRKFKPDYFYGYVSMLDEFAEYTLEKGLSDYFSLKAIITTSEVLSNSTREKLKSVFNTPVYNEYGCGEIGSIAHECSEGQLHLSAENMFVEIIDETGSPCVPGQIGEIVVTELNNTAMPLIRYRLGDYGSLSSDKCACGRGLPVLKEVKGRAYDTVCLQNGKKFHGEFFMYIFEGAKRESLGISQFQIMQKTRNSFLIRLVCDQDAERINLESYISNHMHAGMGDDIGLEFDYVDTIPRSPSGKMQLIKSLDD